MVTPKHNISNKKGPFLTKNRAWSLIFKGYFRVSDIQKKTMPGELMDSIQEQSQAYREVLKKETALVPLMIRFQAATTNLKNPMKIGVEALWTGFSVPILRPNQVPGCSHFRGT
jgi:hypothetical protein